MKADKLTVPACDRPRRWPTGDGPSFEVADLKEWKLALQDFSYPGKHTKVVAPIHGPVLVIDAAA